MLFFEKIIGTKVEPIQIGNITLVTAVLRLIGGVGALLMLAFMWLPVATVSMADASAGGRMETLNMWKYYSHQGMGIVPFVGCLVLLAMGVCAALGWFIPSLVCSYMSFLLYWICLTDVKYSKLLDHGSFAVGLFIGLFCCVVVLAVELWEVTLQLKKSLGDFHITRLIGGMGAVILLLSTWMPMVVVKVSNPGSGDAVKNLSLWLHSVEQDIRGVAVICCLVFVFVGAFAVSNLYIPSLVCSCLSFLTYAIYIKDAKAQGLMENASYGAGFYVWLLLTFVVLLNAIAGIVLKRMAKKK